MAIVRRARPDEWARHRDLRLEMLSDTPHAFLTTLDQARSRTDEDWQASHTSNLLPDSVLVVADGGDRWVGMMAGREFLNYDPPRVFLLSVFVTWAHRGSGLASRLLAEVAEWARQRGHVELHLDVHERATAARAFYAREGFVPTGHTQEYALDPSESELEMVLHLP